MLKLVCKVIKPMLALFVIFGLPQAALATTFANEDFVCPIGGEKFTAQVIVSNTTFGQRPDGKPYSPLPIYPVTECPENGFLIFKKEWTEEELTILENAISTPEFQQIRNNETSYYRLWWLRSKINDDAAILASDMLSASWEADEDPVRKTRYQQAFIRLTKAIERSDNDSSWFWLNLRAANAQRETGQFEESKVHFALVEDNISVVEDEETKAYVSEYITKQRLLLTERNTASEPANMVGEGNAIWRCVIFKAELTASEKPICVSEAVQTIISDLNVTTKDGKELKGEAVIRHFAEIQANQ